MQFKNVTNSSLDIPAIGVKVGPGETFEATGDAAKGLEDQPNVERVDKPATRKTDEDDTK